MRVVANNKLNYRVRTKLIQRHYIASFSLTKKVHIYNLSPQNTKFLSIKDFLVIWLRKYFPVMQPKLQCILNFYKILNFVQQSRHHFILQKVL